MFKKIKSLFRSSPAPSSCAGECGTVKMVEALVDKIKADRDVCQCGLTCTERNEIRMSQETSGKLAARYNISREEVRRIRRCG